MLKRRLTLTLTVLVVALLLGSYPAVPAEADHTTNRIHSCRTIDQSGSYVLDRNLEATGDCLVVATSHVTIDLAGYTISGNGSGNGIRTYDDPATPGIEQFEAITVRDGSITGFLRGIELFGRNHVIERVRATHNDLRGIRLVWESPTQFLGPGGNTVRNSVASENQRIFSTEIAIGIDVLGTGSSIIGNVANSNGIKTICCGLIAGIGIRADCPSTIVNNVATGNGAPFGALAGGDIVTSPAAPGPPVCTRVANSPLP
jgi:hypothetical protein